MLLPFFFTFSSISAAQIPTDYYYYAEEKTQQALKTALHEIAYPQFILKYGSGTGYTWKGFYYTDRNEENNSVVDMYSSNMRYFDGFKSVDGMHIE